MLETIIWILFGGVIGFTCAYLLNKYLDMKERQIK